MTVTELTAPPSRIQTGDCGGNSTQSTTPPKLQAVLFDLGDTILHFATWSPKPFLLAATKPAHHRIAEMGFDPPPYRKYVRRLGSTLLRSMIWSRLTRREVQLVAAFHRCHFQMGIDITYEQMLQLSHLCIAPICDFISIDRDALEVLAGLRDRGLRLGVVSNTLFPATAIDDVLRREGLIDFFPTRIYSSDVGFMKPHPRIFQAALAELGTDAAHALYVGDRLNKDVRGAQRVGMRAVLLAKKNPPRRRRPRPDFTIRSLQELLELVPG